MEGLKGKIKIGQSENNSQNYWVYDDNGFICGGEARNREKLEELVYKVNNSITLKNIDLTGISLVDQCEKVKEEIYEFELAMQEFQKDPSLENRKHVIEEYFDYLQSPLGILEKLGITAQEVMKEYPKHIEKMHFRPRVKEE